ncbi:MAG: HAD family phosphatase [Rhabdochlamydiaceae bacterium]|nr:HAD family phosphatase [Rhabdochlamydiaceae bacterium]
MIKKVMLFLLTTCANLSAAPQAIVFDFGGVMTMEPNREAVVHFLCTSFNLSAEGFEQINQDKKKAVKLGKTDAEFWLQYAKDRKVCLPKDWVQNFNTVMKDAIGVNPEMYELVSQLKGNGTPVAMLSNIDDRLARLIHDFGLYEPFDPCLLSCEIGLEKPDLKIYDVLLKKMNLPAKDIVFVDDRLENVEAAQKMGFDAILFNSQEQLQKELAKRALL